MWMRLAVAVGRTSTRAKTPFPSTSSCFNPLFSAFAKNTRPTTHAVFRTFTSRAAPRIKPGSRSWQWRDQKQGRGRRVLLASSNGALATAAFVTLSEKDNSGTEQTAEKRMLEVSREEIKKKVDENNNSLVRLGQKIVIFLDLYIWEPICTGVRFLQLAAIFVPVILTVPMIWVGNRDPEHDNERSGTLWWYGFLVKAMELAGPAFIKVRSTGTRNT